MKEATEPLMRSAIYGAGSLGTVLGAWMSEAGIPVDLINRNRAHVEALRNRGQPSPERWKRGSLSTRCFRRR